MTIREYAAITWDYAGHARRARSEHGEVGEAAVLLARASRAVSKRLISGYIEQALSLLRECGCLRADYDPLTTTPYASTALADLAADELAHLIEWCEG